MKRVKYSELEPEEQQSIARIAVEFAKCQKEVDRVNSELQTLIRRQKLVQERIDLAREDYARLESSMVERLGGKFDIVTDDEALQAALVAMVRA